MDNSSITSSPTFCVAPWTMVNIDQTGRVMPCMHSGYELGNIKQTTIQQVLRGSPIMELKTAMAAGEWHSSCSWCKQLEETTGASGRTVRQVTLETMSKINADINWFGLEHIVVNWSNLCNLTCVYCNAETSTAWQSLKGIPINHVKNDHADLIELAREHGHSVRGLSLGGGEPLLQKGLLEFLKCLQPDQVRVMVTTNLSMDLEKNSIYQELKTWPSVDWMISFDNTDTAKFEYVREPASWTVFLKNIQIMKQDSQHIMAHPAYSIYNALDLMSYYEFCEQQQLDLYWCELTNPWDLDVRRMNKTLRDLAIQEIEKVTQHYGHTRNMAVNTLQGYKNTLIDNNYLVSCDHPIDPLAWHRDLESKYKKTNQFEQLWPNLVQHLR